MGSVASFPDPRAATAKIVGGPRELLGDSELYRPYEIDGVVVSLPVVLPGVPEYVTVARAEANANDLRVQLLSDLEYSPNPGFPPFQPNASLAIDFYASCGTAIMESVVGVETFANHFVSRHFDERPTFCTIGGKTLSRQEVYDMALNERLTHVLPVLQKTERPTNEPWWTTFRRLQRLAGLKRHGVYDPVEKKGLHGEKPLIQRYLDREYRGAARMMLAAFEFFAPEWISERRREALPELPPE